MENVDIDDMLRKLDLIINEVQQAHAEYNQLQQINAELLAALEAVREEGHANNCLTWEAIEGAFQPECTCALGRVVAAIAKAKGK